MMPVKSNTVTARLIRVRKAKLLGFSRPQTVTELGGVRGFKTSPKLIPQKRHRLAGRAKTISKETETGEFDERGFALVACITCTSAGIFGFAMARHFSSVNPSFDKSSPMWPKYVKERIHSTSAYVLGTVGIASLTVVAALLNPAVRNFMICADLLFGFFGSFNPASGIGKVVVSMTPFQPDEMKLKRITWATSSVFLGLTLLAMHKYPVLLETTTIAIFAATGLNVAILCASNKEVVYQTAPAGTYLGAMLGLMQVSLRGPAARSGAYKIPAPHIYCIQGAFLVIFCGLMLIHTNMVIKHAEDLPPDQIYDPIK